jgi:hypothetical protein
MRKRNIAFILFAVAAMNVITLPIIPLLFNPLWARLGMPSNVINISFTISITAGLIAASILFVAGIIVFFKFRKA